MSWQARDVIEIRVVGISAFGIAASLNPPVMTFTRRGWQWARKKHHV